MANRSCKQGGSLANSRAAAAGFWPSNLKSLTRYPRWRCASEAATLPAARLCKQKASVAEPTVRSSGLMRGTHSASLTRAACTCAKNLSKMVPSLATSKRESTAVLLVMAVWCCRVSQSMDDMCKKRFMRATRGWNNLVTISKFTVGVDFTNSQALPRCLSLKVLQSSPAAFAVRASCFFSSMS